MIIKLFGQAPIGVFLHALINLPFFQKNILTADNSDKRVVIKVVTSNSI